jgi:cytochrome P450
VIDALLKLKEGVYKPSRAKRMRGSFEDARKQALIALSPRSSWRSRRSARTRLFHYFRECLRMEPQGEVLLRQCKSDGARLFTNPQQPIDPALSMFAGNRPIRAGEFIFVAHGSAMKDVNAADEFRLRRRPVDDSYLFYGYGRHKCLGQYISPVIIVESMIAVLGLQGLSRAGDFKLDDKNLYAKELQVNFTDTGSTREIYPIGDE